MEWTYRIKAAVRPRVLMRVAQVFDQQMLSMRRCLMVETAESINMQITVETEEELALRIYAKLCKLLDLLQIDVVAERPSTAVDAGEGRTMGMQAAQGTDASGAC